MRERMEERQVTEKRLMMAKHDMTCWTCTLSGSLTGLQALVTQRTPA